MARRPLTVPTSGTTANAEDYGDNPTPLAVWVTPDGIGVGGPGAWQPLAALVPLAYAANWAVTDWYLDGTVGNDANNGTTALTPLRTGAELSRRLGYGAIQWSHSVTIHLLASIADGINLKYQLLTTGLTVMIVGTATSVLSTTVATYTPAAGNIPKRFTATGVADWNTAGPGGTSLLGSRCRVTSGAATGAIFWIAKIAPDGLGNDVARISNPVGRTQSNLVPAAGNTFEVETLPSVAQLNIECLGPTQPTYVATPGNCIVDSIASGESEFRVQGYQATLAPMVWACAMTKRLTSSVLSEQQGLVVQGCKCSIATVPSCLSFGNLYLPYSGATSLFNDRFVTHNADLIQGIRCNYQAGFCSCSSTTYIMDSPTFGLTVGPRLQFTMASPVCGSGNASQGIELYPGGRIFYRVALPPTLTGTLGDVLLRAPVGVTIPWSARPWNDGERQGHAVALVPGGPAIVAVPYMLTTQSIQVTHNTPAGVGAPGILYAADADRTNTQFGVRSSLAADAGTFDWYIAPLGYNQTIAPLQA